MKRKIKLISLFCGCGGMDLGITGGFEYLGINYPPTGIELVMANDFDHWACETFRKNFGEKIIEGDIREIASDKFPRADIITGGFPCQDFSITRAGKRGGITVKRGQLYKEFVRIVKAKKPKIFVAENVKGILTANKGMAIKIIEKDFSELGYIVKKDLFNFANYGVPQNRERVIIVGIRHDIDFEYKKPTPTHLKSFVSSGEALKGIESVELNNEKIPIMKRTEKVIGAIPEGGNNDDTSDRNYYVKGIMSNIYRRLHRDKPSPTILAGGGGGSWGYHFEEPRPLTNRERARLQSFPDNFEFVGSHTEIRRQIGNAVPPLGAYYIAKSILPAFSAKKRNKKDCYEALEKLARKYEFLYGEDQMDLMDS